MNFKVISYYTPKYSGEADRLKASIKKFDLDAAILPVKSEGSWQANTSMKPDIIYDCLKMFRKPVLFVDADAEFLKYPTFIDDIVDSGEDIAYFLFGRRNELLSGTLYMRPSDDTFKLIHGWKEKIKKYPYRWEQRCLQMAIENTKISYAALPIEYCCIFDCPEREGVEPVIIHHQASRRLNT